MIDLTKYIPEFNELDKRFPIVNELCGGPVGFAENVDGIVIHCTEFIGGCNDGFINSDDCFNIARYFDTLGNLLFRINNKECVNK